jgi:HTH-type transcriptional regulator, sugar sensing transcriptional regulator
MTKTPQNTKLEAILLSAGFSTKEVGVYISLLELGRGTVSQIARKAGINRTTGYDILDNLVGMGLVSISGKEPKQEYVAESPEETKKYMAREIENKKNALKEVERIVPELTTLHNIGSRPKVLFYEGKDGLEKVYEDTLSSHEEILAYASVEDIQPTLPHYFPEYYKRRAKKGIPIRAIFPESPAARERACLDAEEIRQSRIVPAEKYGFHPEINIYDNKVMIASWREKLGIIIESAEIADAMKKIYELAWAEAKRLDKIN